MIQTSYEQPVIGHVINDRPEVSDDYWGGITSIIRINDEYPESTLAGLDEFSHLEVIFKFHLASPADVHLGARSPRNDPRWAPTGTFAHRNHRRPGQLGVAHPRILAVQGRDIRVADLDAVHGTPVLDIAPYFVEFGPQGDLRQPDWPGEMLGNYWREARS
ncbi:TrmO family methyltransferase [Streptacidiphilus sp. MAP5-52]|uniref:TrmO family methyltransferase domain-containing protein n=1 Tax=Streptacidiphilus sp. MAP5-52 TaxID=3156267 RepID=UPI003518F040